MRIAQEEIFGPTTALIPVGGSRRRSRGEQVHYGLSSSIYTRDVNKAFRAMRDLQAGITYINAGTTGAEVHLPVRRHEETGNGHREAGRPRSTCSPSGSRSTSTTRAGCSARRSTSVNRKLVVFVPREALDTVRDALFAAGAGRIGDYERCSWYAEGTGTFLGGTGTSRQWASAGVEERVRRAAARDRVPRRAPGRGGRCAAATRIRTRSRRFDVYALAVDEGAPLHRRRRARQPRARPRTRTCSRPRTERCSPPTARRSASRRTTSPSTAASSPGSEGGRARDRGGRGRCPTRS